MRGSDALFYALAACAAGAAVFASFSRDARRASWAVLVSVAAIALLLVVLGSPVVGVLEAGFVIGAAAMLRRSAPADAEDPAAGDSSAASDTARSTGWGGLLLVAAFFALACHALAIARWPLDPASAASGPAAAGNAAAFRVGLSHYFLASLSLFTIGMFAVVLERSSRAAWIGVELMSFAAVLAIVAAAHFVGGASDGLLLAALVLSASALGPFVAVRLGALDLSQSATHRFANGLVGALVGITIALLTDTW
jgi:NADH:ubiquinone oxidoreductase subunit K